MITNFIKQYTDVDGLPLLNEEQWHDAKTRFDKDEFRKAMVEYIVNEKPPFPFKRVDKEEVVELFINLCKEPKSVDHVDKVVTKFKYDREFGGIVFNGKPKFNKVSDYFQRENRYRCDTKHNPSILTSWEEGRGLFGILNSFWTMKKNEWSRKSWDSILHVAAHVASQFRPAVVKNIIEHFNAKIYMDMSCGWGDRLAGFYASNAEHYIGFDPSTKTFPIYDQQKAFYEFLLGNKKKTTLLNLPAEDVDYSELPEVDLFFSSPPYFMAEKYEDNPNQSWVRYKTIDAWQFDFLHVALEKAWGRIKEGGHMLVNISDIIDRKDHTRVHICDRLCDFMDALPESNYVGFYGMKLSLRPNILIEHDIIDAPYVEPIWVFRKGKDLAEENDILDLFE